MSELSKKLSLSTDAVSTENKENHEEQLWVSFSNIAEVNIKFFNSLTEVLTKECDFTKDGYSITDFLSNYNKMKILLIKINNRKIVTENDVKYLQDRINFYSNANISKKYECIEESLKILSEALKTANELKLTSPLAVATEKISELYRELSLEYETVADELNKILNKNILDFECSTQTAKEMHSYLDKSYNYSTASSLLDNVIAKRNPSANAQELKKITFYVIEHFLVPPKYHQDLVGLRAAWSKIHNQTLIQNRTPESNTPAQKKVPESNTPAQKKVPESNTPRGGRAFLRIL